jgi:hypothetical protein
LEGSLADIFTAGSYYLFRVEAAESVRRTAKLTAGNLVANFTSISRGENKRGGRSY